MIFIDCSLISTKWQSSLYLFKRRKQTAIYKRETMYKTIPKDNNRNRKQIYKRINQI